MLLSTKHFNVIGGRKLVPCFVGPFFYYTVGWTFSLPAKSGNTPKLSTTYLSISLFLGSFHEGGDGYLHPTAVYVEDEQE